MDIIINHYLCEICGLKKIISTSSVAKSKIQHFQPKMMNLRSSSELFIGPKFVPK